MGSERVRERVREDAMNREWEKAWKERYPYGDTPPMGKAEFWAGWQAATARIMSLFTPSEQGCSGCTRSIAGRPYPDGNICTRCRRYCVDHYTPASQPACDHDDPELDTQIRNGQVVCMSCGKPV